MGGLHIVGQMMKNRNRQAGSLTCIFDSRKTRAGGIGIGIGIDIGILPIFGNIGIDIDIGIATQNIVSEKYRFRNCEYREKYRFRNLTPNPC